MLQKYNIDEIRMDLIGYCYFESLVSFYARNKYTFIIPRSIIALVDYWIFKIYVCLAQSDYRELNTEVSFTVFKADVCWQRLTPIFHHWFTSPPEECRNQTKYYQIPCSACFLYLFFHFHCTESLLKIVKFTQQPWSP